MPGTPVAYSLTYSFTAFETVNPSTPKSGPVLDSQFAAVALAINSLIAALSDVRRSDGNLHDASVSLDTLDTAVTAMLGGKFNPRGLWVTGTGYAVNDLVRAPDSLSGTYICGKAHTSGVWATDKAAGDWLVLNAADTGGAAQGVPSPGDGDTGKYLFATGADNPTWQPLAASFNNIDNGTQNAPTITFVNDNASGFYSLAAGQLSLTLGGLKYITWTGTTMGISLANIITLDADMNGLSYLKTTTGALLPGGVAMSWHQDVSGNVDSLSFATEDGTATWSGGFLVTGSAATPTADTHIGVAGGTARVSLSGGSPYVAWRESNTASLRWQLLYDAASNELRFSPLAAYNIRAAASTIFAGPQTGSPASSGGIAAWDVGVQNNLYFGQGSGTPAFSISYTGVAVLASLSLTGNLTVAGAFSAATGSLGAHAIAVSSGGVVPTGSTSEFGPFNGASANTIDVGAGEVVTGFRADGAGSYYIRTRALVIS